jgi:putative DNA primase/helicase
LDVYYYANGYYKLGGCAEFKNITYKSFPTIIYKKLYTEFEERLKSITHKPYNYFSNNNPRYINLNNCFYDIQNGKKFPHSPDRLFTYKIPVDYQPEAKYDFFEKFVSEVVEKPNRRVVQELFGYCLYTDMPIQKAFMLYGTGANGKDVLLYALSKLLGMENISSESLKSITEDRFSAVELQHRLANISNETPNNFRIVNTDIFKSLRGGSLISGQRKFGQRVVFRNYAKMIFSANKVPQTNDFSYSFFRSWMLIGFPNRFEGLDDKKDLKYDLTDSPDKMSGILNYALVGLKRLLDFQQFTAQSTVFDIGEEWRKISESPLSFIKDKVAGGDKSDFMLNKVILKKYHEYCKEYGISPESDKQFWTDWNKYMEQLFPDAQKKQDSKTGLKGWRGIRVP